MRDNLRIAYLRNKASCMDCLTPIRHYQDKGSNYRVYFCRKCGKVKHVRIKGYIK